MEKQKSGKTISQYFFDYLDDKINPLLLKDLRSWTRSKALICFFFVEMFFILLCTTSLVLLMQKQQEAGFLTFTIITAGLSLISGMIIPAIIYFKFSRELKHKEIELLLISSIKPAEIVKGKAGSALAASLLSFSAAAPSLAMSYLLGGVDIISAASSLILLATISITAPLLSIFLASASTKAIFRSITILILVCEAIACPLLITAILFSGRNIYNLDLNTLLVIVPVSLCTISAAGYFFYCAAAARLSPAGTNRDTKPRTALSILIFFLLSSIFSTHWFTDFLGSGAPIELHVLSRIAAVQGAIIFTVCTIFILDTPDFPPPATIKSWPRSSLWSLFYYPGHERLCAYILLHFTIFFLLCLPTFHQKLYFIKAIGYSMNCLCFLSIGFIAHPTIITYYKKRNLNKPTLLFSIISTNIIWLLLTIGCWFFIRIFTNRAAFEVFLFCPVTFSISVTNIIPYPALKASLAIPFILSALTFIVFGRLAIWAFQEGRQYRNEALESQ